MSHEHLDVLIVGAGLSGIGAAHHLHASHPERTYALIESREALGGTWSLFQYPGIRSDSDMHTLGFGFRPWKEAKVIADGPAILSYLEDTAREEGIDQHIRYGRKVTRASWSTERARWTVTIELVGTGETEQITCGFLLGCTGYYRYDEGYTPHFEGRDRFAGEIVHPQHWPEDLDYADKRVVVIGSGATAVTLVPAMATDAAHVTMLQRSPTWISSLPSEDAIGNAMRRWLPDAVAFPAVRWKNVLTQIGLYQLSRRRPEVMKRFLRKNLIKQLPNIDVDRHFTPSYNPWDQRLCLVPDGDLFKALRSGSASVVTDRIQTFTEQGILLESGEALDADVIITATGLNLLIIGGIELTVDGAPVEMPEAVTYKGMMFEGVPNFAFAIGYTNASWTLKADLMGGYISRLLSHMDKRGTPICVPRHDGGALEKEPLLDFGAGYVQRSLADLPKQASKAPWKLKMNYASDVISLRYGSIADGVMRFETPRSVPAGGDAGAGAAERVTA